MSPEFESNAQTLFATEDLVDERVQKELISLDEILNMNYYPKYLNATFLTDDTLIYKDEFNNLIRATINNQTLDKRIWVKNISFVSKSILQRKENLKSG